MKTAEPRVEAKGSSNGLCKSLMFAVMVVAAAFAGVVRNNERLRVIAFQATSNGIQRTTNQSFLATGFDFSTHKNSNKFVIGFQQGSSSVKRVDPLLLVPMVEDNEAFVAL